MAENVDGMTAEAKADRHHLLDFNLPLLRRTARELVASGGELTEDVWFVGDLRDAHARAFAEGAGVSRETIEARSLYPVPTVIGTIPLDTAKQIFASDGPRIRRLLDEPLPPEHFRVVVLASDATTYAVVSVDDPASALSTDAFRVLACLGSGHGGGTIRKAMTTGVLLKEAAERGELDTIVAELIVPERSDLPAGLDLEGVKKCFGEYLGFATAWAANGFPRIAIRRHVHAAMLMWTDTAAAAVADARAPWDAFAIAIPNQLLEVRREEANVDITTAFVRVHDSGACWIAAADDAEIYASCMAPSLSDLGASDAGDRVLELVCRLVLGVCLDITEHRPSGYIPGAKLAVKRRRGEPQTNSFVVTRDVDVDCRASVRDYVVGKRVRAESAGRSASPIQRLHRGHWQQQVHGPRNSLRKWKFHRPYWQGDEGGPIALRTHVLDKTG